MGHPPTLFMHGTSDQIVPPWTSLTYFSTLQQYGIKTARHTQQGAGHQWIDQAPNLILNWISQHSSTVTTATDLKINADADETIVQVPQSFKIQRGNGCLHIDHRAGEEPQLVVQHCTDQSTLWVQWESDAIAPASSTNLCLQVNPHSCSTGSPVSFGRASVPRAISSKSDLV